MRKAVIDVGSNSVLLAVGDLVGDSLRPVAEASQVTGLGEGTKKTGLLSEAGMARTLAALREFFDTATAAGANEVIAKATMAARIASNSDEFLRSAERQGTPVDVLSGEHEAELGFRAVADDPLFARSRRITIIDPGGNSTELATADRLNDGWTIRFRRSYPIGTLGLRDGPLAEEAPGHSSRMDAVREIDLALGMEYLPGASGAAVVLGAAGTNLVTMRKRMAEWDPELVHGETLEFGEVSRAAGRLCDMTEAQRAQIVGLEKGREGTIHIGALILERFMFAIHTAEVIVSVRGWRHALLEAMLRRID